MDRTTLARNLKPLQRQGLVQVEVGDDQGDRRVRIVRLTEKGREALRQALPLWEEAQAQVVGALGEERLRHALQEVAALEAVALRREP
jgi:DNA-binding MarR family transcriptional regulator